MPAPSDRPSWRRALAGGAVVLALSGLAACGGGDDSGSNSSNSFAVGGGSSSSAPAAPDVKPGDKLSSDQVSDIIKTATTSMKTAHVTMDMSGQAAGQSVAMKAQGDMQFSPIASHLTMSVMGQNIEAIMVDGSMYMKSPLLGGGDKWAKADLSKALGSAGVSSDAMTNPLALLDKVSGAVSSATYKGDEQVDGASAKHYVIVVDGAKLAQSMGLKGTEASAVPQSTNEDLWVDDKGRAVQTKVSMGSTGTVTTHLSDFDKDVSISAPPASQVTELPTP